MSADLQFKQLIDRILRCREAEDAAKDDTKEVYAELKALGYDKTAAGALVGELRKKDKDPEKFTERNATLDLYRDAYERAGASRAHTHTREDNEQAAAKSAADETHQRPSNSDEPSPEAGPQAEASHCQDTGVGTLADREGRIEGEAASVDLPTNSPSAALTPEQLSAPEVAPPSALGATPFQNPRCQHPGTCHFADSRESCHDCLMAWSQRPRDEQLRLWAEAMGRAA